MESPFRKNSHLTMFRLCIGLGLAAFPTRLSADNPTPGCSLIVVNSAVAPCYTATALPGSVTIDGTLTGAEYTGAPARDLTGDFAAKFRVKQDANSLHLLISVSDTGFNASDRIELNFDPLHNLGITTDDVTFRIKRGNTDHRKITAAGGDVVWTPGANLALRDASQGTVPPDFATGWSAEVTITAADLGRSDLPAILGFAIRAVNQDTSDQTQWPSPFPATPATWGNLKTRYPIKYMLVLDQSGSMLDQNKWTLAKQATNFFVNTMAILRESIYFEDKVGTVTFSWNEGGGVDQTTTPKPLAIVPAFPAGNYADAANPVALATPHLDYWTPIGKGLDAAFTAVNTAAGPEESQRIVLLVSDGIQNRPASQTPLLPNYLSYNCGPADWSPCASTLVQVSTVALGQDSGVDAAVLDGISTHFGGQGTTYNITTDAEELKRFFISGLEEPYQMNVAFDGASGTEFILNPNERKLVVILSWTPPGGTVAFTMQTRPNAAASWTDVACNTSATESATVGYAICVVNNPVAGSWRPVDAAKNPVASASRQFALVDLNLRARFTIDRQVHGTSQDIILTADLNEAGTPVTNASPGRPVNVSVRIRRPGESFGTYVSTHDPGNCQAHDPQLPPLTGRTGIRDLAGGQLPAAGFPAVSAVALNDVLPPRFSKINALFRQCQKDGLVFVEDPGVELHDDGLDGDEHANDGIYTLRFRNSQFDGSYTFGFKAGGVGPAAAAFQRVKTMAAYVRVDAAPSQTTFGSRVFSQTTVAILREYYVIPRDLRRNYLGPGHPDQIQFIASRGTWVTPIVDYNNGIYSQVLSYDQAGGEPDVVPVVQGKPFPGTGGTPLTNARWEISLSGLVFVPHQSAFDDFGMLAIRAGRYVSARNLVGLDASLFLNGPSRQLFLAGFFRHYFTTANPRILPFIGIAAGVSVADYGGTTTGFLSRGDVGLKYFVSRRASLDFAYSLLHVQTSNGGPPGSTLSATSIGLSFLF